MDRQNPSSQHSALPQSAISLMDWRTDGWIDISVSFAIHNPRSRNPQFTKFLSFSTTIFHSNYLNKDKESQRQTGRPERRCQPSTPPLSMRLAIRRWIKKKEIEKGKKKRKKKKSEQSRFCVYVETACWVENHRHRWPPINVRRSFKMFQFIVSIDVQLNGPVNKPAECQLGK